jgi:hypothetical protein
MPKPFQTRGGAGPRTAGSAARSVAASSRSSLRAARQPRPPSSADRRARAAPPPRGAPPAGSWPPPAQTPLCPRSVGPGPAPRRATCLRNTRGGIARGGCGHQNGAQSFGATPLARAPRSAGWLRPGPLRRRRPRPRRMSTKWLNRPSGCGARPRRGERRPAGLRPGARGARERRWRGRAGRGARACARASEGVVVHPQLRQCPAARQHRRERARARIRHARVRHVEQRQRARPLVALAVLCPSRCCRRQPARERCHPVVAQRIRSVLAPPP